MQCSKLKTLFNNQSTGEGRSIVCTKLIIPELVSEYVRQVGVLLI